MPETIRTERLILRRARVADLVDLHEVMRHPQAMTFWSTPPHPDMATTLLWLGRKLHSDSASPAEFVLEFQGKAIGTAGGGTLPEVGYILHPDYWRQGLAFEAMEAVIAQVFDAGLSDHLIADVDPRNLASVKLLGRLGFGLTGHADNTFCIEGIWAHSDYYRLDQSAWAERSHSPRQR